MIGETVVGDHGVLSEDGEVMDHWSYSVAGVEKRELFAFHLVAFTRAELGDRLVTLHDA